MSRDDTFRFKQFAVAHNLSSMPVGTDAILLGAWAAERANEKPHPTPQVLDVGTGCGVIALMMAQQLPHASITAIDIHPDSITQAADNFRLSPWADRLQAIRADFNTFHCDNNRYHTIVSNPPFFANGPVAPDTTRANARHGLHLSIEQLLARSAGLLDADGILCIVVPTATVPIVEREAAFAALRLLCRTDVATTAGKQPKRTLFCLGLRPKPMQHTRFTLQQPDGSPTDHFRRLCQDFLLHM